MGSLFSYSKPSSYTPMSYAIPQASKPQSPVTVSNQDTEISKDKDEIAKVEDVIRRTTRGRNSTIQTSYRGVLTEQTALMPKRKNLLGE